MTWQEKTTHRAIFPQLKARWNTVPTKLSVKSQLEAGAPGHVPAQSAGSPIARGVRAGSPFPTQFSVRLAIAQDARRGCGYHKIGISAGLPRIR